MRSLTFRGLFLMALVFTILCTSWGAQNFELITGPYEELGPTSVVLTGTAIPSGTVPNGWLHFRISKVGSSETKTTQYSRLVGVEVVSVSHQVIYLEPDTVYTYELVEDGISNAKGGIQSFRTLSAKAPIIQTGNRAPNGVPGNLVTVYGEGFAEGSTAYLNNIAVPTWAKSSTITFQVPVNYPPGIQLNLSVETNGLRSNSVPFITVALQPFVSGVADSKWRTNTRENPLLVNEGEPIQFTVIATGLGRVTNQPRTGEVAKASPISEMITEPDVWIGDKAMVEFAGLMPGQLGLYQVNVKVDRVVVPPSGYLYGKITVGGEEAYFPVYLARKD